jgi:bifunctional non-homologous end joining protein LigD
LFAFDLIELDGEDFRLLPQQAQNLAGPPTRPRDARDRTQRAHGRRRSRRVPSSLQDRLEGIVSKRVTAPYRSGPSRDWIKVKNPDSPAVQRARQGRW